MQPQQQEAQQGGVGGRREAAESFGGIPLPLFVREGVEGMGRGGAIGSAGGSSSSVKAREETVSLLEGIRRVRVSEKVRVQRSKQACIQVVCLPLGRRYKVWCSLRSRHVDRKAERGRGSREAVLGMLVPHARELPVPYAYTRPPAAGKRTSQVL